MKEKIKYFLKKLKIAWALSKTMTIVKNEATGQDELWQEIGKEIEADGNTQFYYLKIA